MFKLAQNPTYTAPINVDLPIDGGKVKKLVFTAVFKRQSTSEVASIYERLEAGELNDAKLIDEVMVGWGDDVQDENGDPLEYNDKNKEKLIDIYPVRPSIVRGFFVSINGAKAKN